MAGSSSPASPVPAAELRAARKVHPRGSSRVVALDGVDLVLARGESVAIMGPSGSGKSTLLHLLGGLDRPSSGQCLIDGVEVARLDDAALSRLRNRRLGFVFQSFHLIPQLTVAENVETPLLYSERPEDEWRDRALAALAEVGLAERATHRPSELSGGEAQRVAIARALVNEPTLVLADEPTGNLDRHTGARIADMLFDLARGGRTLVVVTHDASLAERAGRVVHIADGRLQDP
jgi:putative ABC transport system ATP-binding protein